MAWDTAAYYTFSTVAQTLAGALGLLAAFVIIRSTSLTQLIRADAEDLFRDVGAKDEQRRAYLACDWPLLMQLYREAYAASQANKTAWPALNERHFAVLAHAERRIKARRLLLKHVSQALVFSVVVMGLAMLGVPLTPWLSRVPGIAGTILVAEALLAIACLAWFAKLVVGTLEE